MKIKKVLTLSFITLLVSGLIGCSSKIESDAKRQVEVDKEIIKDNVFESDIQELRQVAKNNAWDKIYDTKSVKYEARNFDGEREYEAMLNPTEMGEVLITTFKDDGELINKKLHYNDRVYTFKEETDEVDFTVASLLPDKSPECLAVKDLPKNVIEALNDPDKYKLSVKKIVDEETENIIWHIEFERGTIPYYHVQRVELEVSDKFYIERAVFYCKTSNCERFDKESYIVDTLSYTDDKINIPDSVLKKEKELNEKQAKRESKK